MQRCLCLGQLQTEISMPVHLKTLLSRVRSFRKADDGQALVELAICLPMLLFIVMGICTFGIAINNYISLTSATSSGTRALSVNRGNTSDPCQTLSSTVSSAAPLLKSASLTYSLTLTPYGGTAATYTGTSCAGATSNLSASATAKVTVTYPCTLIVMNQNFAANCKLTAVDTELVQ